MQGNADGRRGSGSKEGRFRINRLNTLTALGQPDPTHGSIPEVDETEFHDSGHNNNLNPLGHRISANPGGHPYHHEVQRLHSDLPFAPHHHQVERIHSVCSDHIEEATVSRVESDRRNSGDFARRNFRKNSMELRRNSSIRPPLLRRKTSVFLPEIDEADDIDPTFVGKTLANFTHDALPRMDNYRNLMSIQAMQRPTLDDLHDQNRQYNKMRNPSEQNGDDEGQSGSTKFGWVEGVLVRCLLNIWGVMLFLRLSWMVGQAGLIQSMIIIVISTIVTTITTLSMAAVSTNGEMKGGGIYYMISRSLGPEWGGAIGVVFSFANAGMAALNTVGFSESLISLLKESGYQIVDGGQNDNRIISVIAVVLLQGIIVVGKEYEAKAQVGLLVILLIAMSDFVIGAFVGPLNDEVMGKGWIGLNSQTFVENLGGGYRKSEGQDQDFFTVFSIFFPAVAGIQAGASISGDLQDPASAIPKGTLLAIALTSASYALFAFLAGAGTVRDATGNVTDLINGTFPSCPSQVTDNTTLCRWGLYNDFQVMNLMSLFGPLIYAGCFAATLSSALSCLVSGSEMFQALCKDKVYPYMTRFGKGYGKKKDPYFSYAAGFLVALIFILIADLNAIAPLISNFFMVTYALLNFCTFHASILKPLGWRPTFKYYNTWVSLIGAILCVAVMFLMSWVTALISFGCVIALYVIVLYRKPDINWGSTTQAQAYQDALGALQSLTTKGTHVKNFKPQIMALTGYPSSRPVLLDFAKLITKNNSLLICGNVSRFRQPVRYRRAVLEDGYDWLSARNTKAFYVVVDGCEIDQGAKSLVQSSGLGKLAPNIVLLGYKSDWQTCDREQVNRYFNVLHEALDNYMAIAILRVKDGLDISHLITSPNGSFHESKDFSMMEKENSSNTSLQSYENQVAYDPSDPDGNLEEATHTVPEILTSPTTGAKRKRNKLIFGKNSNKGKAEDVMGVYRGPDGSELPKDIVQSISLFTTKQPEGTIDVWWLYDDGGLTLLLPYIMTTRRNWASCKLRVFALSNKKSEIEMEHVSMASLLSKFRIDYSDLTVIPDITRKAGNEAKKFFDSIIKDFRGDPNESDNPETIITDSELQALKEKTNRHLRLRELLLEHSKSSNFVVMTMPVPRKGTVSAPLYLAWLECLTRDMPPFLLVRGNQTSVLTFYS